MGNIEKLVTQINTVYYDPSESARLLLENSVCKDIAEDQKKAEINKICEKISSKSLQSAALQDDQRFFHVAFSEYGNLKRNEQDNLIYKFEKSDEDYYISTGLYCGVINLGNSSPQIEIQTGYSDFFLKRIINYCCGIYADTFTSKSSAESESIYSLLVQYMFLISLRKVAERSIPKKYVYLTGRDYAIKGNLDINAYVNHDLLSYDKKVTFQYPELLEIQPIIDVLYSAMKRCKIKGMKGLPRIVNFESQLRELYSGKRPSKRMIKNIQNEKCLSNSLYSGFKRPLEYARILLESNDLNSGGNKSIDGVSGFLVDSSFLWEMYLYNLMKLHLDGWDIEAQRTISFYDETFYPKNNYPDFVLTNRATGEVFIFDAKFKRMNFKGIDVDNEDLRQLHAYSYYFQLTEGDKFRGAGLIYPTKVIQPEDVKTEGPMYGIASAKQKLGIFSVKDPDGEETIIDNERAFIDALKEFLNT